MQRLHHWRQRPVRKRGFDVSFKMIPPSRRRLNGRDAIFQHNVMRCVFERQSGEPAPVHQGPGRPVIMMAMARQKAGELLARLPQHAHRRQSRARQIADRLMGWVWNPHWRQFIRSVQFGQVNRVASVLTRSPGLREINDGATTTHSCPASLSWR